MASFLPKITPTYRSAAAAKSLQSCPTLCDPIDGSPPGSSVHGILQARTLEWVAISSSNAWKWKVKVKLLSHVLLLETPWTAAHQAPLSMGFSRQEYWSGVPLPLGCTWWKFLTYILTYDLTNTACYIIVLYCLLYEIVSFITKCMTKPLIKWWYSPVWDQWL